MKTIKYLIIALPFLVICSPLYSIINSAITFFFVMIVPFMWLALSIFYFVRQKVSKDNYWFLIITITIFLPMSFFYLISSLLIAKGGV